MKFQDQLDLVKAIEKIANTLDIDPLHVAGRIVFLDKKKAKIVSDALKEVDKFRGSDIVTRGKMLGLSIKKVP